MPGKCVFFSYSAEPENQLGSLIFFLTKFCHFFSHKNWEILYFFSSVNSSNFTCFGKNSPYFRNRPHIHAFIQSFNSLRKTWFWDRVENYSLLELSTQTQRTILLEYWWKQSSIIYDAHKTEDMNIPQE